MYFLNHIEQYILKQSSEEDSLLAELTRETHIKVLNPRMISGHPQGILLKTLSKMMQPERILELGTFTGYSAICLAEGLRQGGLLYTIDKNDEVSPLAEKYFKKAGIENSVKRVLGDALEIIPTLNEVFDLVFIDADKKNYLKFYKLIIDKVRSGGVILADNVLWNGKVTENQSSWDDETRAIHEFNEFVKNDKRVIVTIIPLRDGVSLISKP
ncbi:MAG: O-methyltransferase [Bacteroidales bacterium]|nr:O-methyltransferase [Bacteroidales bacterium]MBN2818913.1 O-methyltransferase [Bacteroidales bacterium]